MRFIKFIFSNTRNLILQLKEELKSRKRHEVWGFTLIVLIFAGYYLNEFRIKKDVLSNYEETYGRIVDFSIVGTNANEYLYYEFIVDNKRYTRSISNIHSKYKICYEDLAFCKTKRFWVIYSPDNPRNSLIDLSREIQDIKDPIFPESLDKFE